MTRGRPILSFVAFLSLAFCAGAREYEAKWGSLDGRPVPQWWRDAKFGIFVHWGPYAVPAYAPTDGKDVYACYAEWYHGRLIETNEQFCAHHKKHYGDAPYGNFAAEFKAENFNPDAWAELFKKSGARYAVLTSKHHDGYALWPSAVTPYYNSVALGSGRDLAGEFTVAMKKAGLRSGFYYSLLEYANPLYPKKRTGKNCAATLPMKDWARRVNLPQMKELVENYQADIIWPDGEWDWPAEDQCSEEFLAWLYNESSVRDSVVVSDRWGKGCRGQHGGHYTTEYGDGEDGTKGHDSDAVHPWEECRGIGKSFGYNRMETTADYMSREKCIETLVDVVSRGGNLLLNVGPTADGRIPAIMEDRLLAIGRWLEVNGEAIYGTTRWAKADPSLRKKGIYFTRKGAVIYLIFTRGPQAEIIVPSIGKVRDVRPLGFSAKVTWRQENDGLVLSVPPAVPTELPGSAAWTLRIETDAGGM